MIEKLVMPRHKDKKVQFALILLSLAVGLLICEGIVRLIRPASDIFPANPAADPILGIRLLPFQSGHDAKGFRNSSADGNFPIICIGDSMIYGIGVPRKYAIPQQLSRLLHERVYNMGLGSFGPVQYYQLLEQSRQMHPQATIVALFLGNDLRDAAYMVQEKAHWQWLAQDIGEAGQLQHITACAAPGGDQVSQIPYQDPSTITITLKTSGSYLWDVHSYLRLHSGLYALTYEGLVKPFIRRFFERSVHLKRPGAFYTPVVDTIFVPDINLSSMNPHDPQVRLGLLVTEKIIGMMAQGPAGRENRRSVRFVIMPTKENVYYDYLTSKKVTLPPRFECAVHYERQITRWLQQVITAKGFRFIDVYTPMVEAANRGTMLYHASSDAHPNIIGNRLVAQTLAQALKP
jgi:hypothetical protein